MAYALAVLAVWHAAFEGRDADLNDLEEHYCLKKLFWDKERNREDFDLSQYLNMASPNRPARGAPVDEQRACAEQCLRRIRENYAQEAFRPDMPFGELLERVEQRNRREADAGREERPIYSYLPPLREVLRNELPAGAVVPEDPPREARQAATDPFRQEIRSLLENGVKLVVFTGAAGTGKTYTAKKLAGELGAPLPGPAGARPYALVQFHPSYDYTDFVEGLRPVQTDGQMQFVKLDGSFKAFCRQVAELNKQYAGREEKDPDRRYFIPHRRDQPGGAVQGVRRADVLPGGGQAGAGAGGSEPGPYPVPEPAHLRPEAGPDAGAQ